jgi:hypothetical protein
MAAAGNYHVPEVAKAGTPAVLNLQVEILWSDRAAAHPQGLFQDAAELRSLAELRRASSGWWASIRKRGAGP